MIIAELCKHNKQGRVVITIPSYFTEFRETATAGFLSTLSAEYLDL